MTLLEACTQNTMLCKSMTAQHVEWQCVCVCAARLFMRSGRQTMELHLCLTKQTHMDYAFT